MALIAELKARIFIAKLLFYNVLVLKNLQLKLGLSNNNLMLKL